MFSVFVEGQGSGKVTTPEAYLECEHDSMRLILKEFKKVSIASFGKLSDADPINSLGCRRAIEPRFR